MIDTIIPFCSYDYKFIDATIDGIRDVSKNIIVTYFDYTFDGKPENLELINQVKNRNTDCKFIPLDYDFSANARWHHNQTRWVGLQFCKSDYVLFLDSDEVFEKQKIKQWLDSNIDTLKDVTTFANYWYFRSPKYRAKVIEDSPVMIKKDIASYDYIFDDLERASFKYAGDFSKSLQVMGLDGLPMCHHYSWALSKEEMLRKVSSWGHKGEKNWEQLINEEFSREFNGKDFIHEYEYEICEPLIK
jgi:hypothetical protein